MRRSPAMLLRGSGARGGMGGSAVMPPEARCGGRGASADSLRLKFMAAAEAGLGAPRVAGREEGAAPLPGKVAAAEGRENDTDALRAAGGSGAVAAVVEVLSGGGACVLDADSPRGRPRRFSWLLLRARSAAFIRSIERLDG